MRGGEVVKISHIVVMKPSKSSRIDKVSLLYL